MGNYTGFANSNKENWVFLIVDTKKAFNKINIIRMLWMILHLWPSGACFVFNFYHHHSLLVLINGDGKANIIHSREGVTQ